MSIERPRPTVIEADANADVPFYIPATEPETRLRRTLKRDDSFLVIDAHGDIGASAGTGDGLFYRDTRFFPSKCGSMERRHCCSAAICATTMRFLPLISRMQIFSPAIA